MSEPLPCQDEACWRHKLTTEQYRILREKGTEPPFSGQYIDCFADGSYHCAACDQMLFTSAQKFSSGCGWPSFDDCIDGSVAYHFDNSCGMVRVEVTCANCGSHLGHVFPDGPAPTGQRYCINSASLNFEPQMK